MKYNRMKQHNSVKNTLANEKQKDVNKHKHVIGSGNE